MTSLHEAIEHFRDLDEDAYRGQKVKQVRAGLKHNTPSSGPQTRPGIGRSTTKVAGGKFKPRVQTGAARLRHHRNVANLTR
jgi:hypothetical protein